MLFNQITSRLFGSISIWRISHLLSLVTLLAFCFKVIKTITSLKWQNVKRKVIVYVPFACVQFSLISSHLSHVQILQFKFFEAEEYSVYFTYFFIVSFTPYHQPLFKFESTCNILLIRIVYIWIFPYSLLLDPDSCVIEMTNNSFTK
jgi:hypothetical protein